MPLYLLGRRVLEILPYVPIAARSRTGVSVFGYCDRAACGVTGDHDSAPEVERLACGVEREIERLRLAFRPRRRYPDAPGLAPRPASARKPHGPGPRNRTRPDRSRPAT